MKKLRSLLATTYREFRNHTFNPRRYLEIVDVELERDHAGVHYRLAERRDIVEMLAIERDVYDGEVPWTFSHFEYEIVKNDEAFFVTAEVEDKVVGFIGARLGRHSKAIHITNLAVLREFQKRGIGSFLIEQLVQMMTLLGKEEMTLEVRRDNTEAQGVYRRRGFVTDKILAKYYQDGADAIWMVKKLKNEPEN